jgi:hypothetical protein
MKYHSLWRLANKFLFLVLAATTSLTVTFAQVRADEIQAGGGASDDFQLDPALTLQNPAFQLGAVIERDRMYMAARPGWQVKHIPFSFDEQGLPYSGGVYLFDTQEDAENFSQWLSQDFSLDGVLILQRPYFLGIKAYTYKVIGAFRFDENKMHKVVVRTERWQTPGGAFVEPFLRGLYPLIRLEANKRHYTEVWLLYNDEANIVNIVYFRDRVGPNDPTTPDFATLEALASDPSMGKVFDSLKWTKLFDRTSWVLTSWPPFVKGDQGEAAVWPNSPPFPQPFSGDAVCVPSRGENNLNSPECLSTCGDGVAQDGENTLNCPGDVSL